MPRFDVRHSTSDGSPVMVVRCPECGTDAEHAMSRAVVGADVSCSSCGRAIIITPDNLAWIRSRADMLGVPDQRPFSADSHVSGIQGTSGQKPQDRA